MAALGEGAAVDLFSQRLYRDVRLGIWWVGGDVSINYQGWLRFKKALPVSFAVASVGPP